MRHGFFANLKKCQFYKDEVYFLDYIILAPKVSRANNNKFINGDSSEANETIMIFFKNKKSRNLTHMPNIGAKKKPNFLTSNAKKTFNHLRLVFIKAPILLHFDLKSYIQIETDPLSYTISRVLNQLNLNSDTLLNDSDLKSDFNQWHPITNFFRKIIPAET